MSRDPRTFLWEARQAADHVASFVEGRTWDDYQADKMLRSAVERQLEIVGEALNQLSRADPETTARIADLGRIVAFRNLLIHGYAIVDDRLVWEVATDRTDALITTLDELLGDR